MPGIEVGKPVGGSGRCLDAQRGGVVLEREGAAGAGGAQDAEHIAAQFAAVVVPSLQPHVRRRNTLAGKGLFQKLLEQLGGREHQPTVGVWLATALAGAGDDAGLLFSEEVWIQLLAQAAYQSRGLAGAGRAEDQQALIQWQTEDLILVLVEHGLVAQAHLRDEAAPDAVDDVGAFTLSRKDLAEQVFDLLGRDHLAQQLAQRDDGERAVVIGFIDGVTRVPAIGQPGGPQACALDYLHPLATGQDEVFSYRQRCQATHGRLVAGKQAWHA